MRRTSRMPAPASSPKPVFSQDDLLDSLRELFERRGTSDDGLTTREVAAAKGWCQERTDRWLREAWTRGLIESGRSHRLARDGAMRQVPVYRLKHAHETQPRP